jgi:hypothetical protein
MTYSPAYPSRHWAQLIRAGLNEGNYRFTEPWENVLVLPFKGKKVNLEMAVILGPEVVQVPGVVIFIVNYPFSVSDEKIPSLLASINDRNSNNAFGSFELRIIERIVRYKYAIRLHPGDSFDVFLRDMIFVLDNADNAVDWLFASV